MIYINLLPVRAAKKRESVRFQLTVAGLVIFLVAAVSMAFYLTARSEASSLAARISEGNEELGRLKSKIGELSRIKKQKRIVEEKLNIVRKLEAARTGPTRLLQRLTDAIPPKAWLRSVRDEGDAVILQGFAANDEVVAEFMRGLGRYREWATIDLDVVQRVTEPESGAEVVRFVLKIGKAKAGEVE